MSDIINDINSLQSSHNSASKNYLKLYLEHDSKFWWAKIREFARQRTPRSLDLTWTCEFLTSVTKGTSSSSHSFDNQNRDEIKFVNLFQPKKCIDCYEKNKITTRMPPILFGEPFKCPRCGGDNFEDIDDSRANINCKSHFKNIDKTGNYFIWVLKHDKELSNINDDSKIVLNLECYRIRKDQIYFNRILKHQVKYGTLASKNLLPYSYDFFFCEPCKVCKIKFILSHDTTKTDWWDCDSNVEIDFLDIENNIPEKLPIEKIFSAKYKKECILEGYFTENDVYAEITSFPLKTIPLGQKKNTHGKKRGIINRKKI